jgi:hypothetical protein
MVPGAGHGVASEEANNIKCLGDTQRVVLVHTFVSTEAFVKRFPPPPGEPSVQNEAPFSAEAPGGSWGWGPGVPGVAVPWDPS